jgi:pyruvate-formate lyase
MYGGYASSLSIDPGALEGKLIDEKLEILRDIINGIFGFSGLEADNGGFYAYFNVASISLLRDVMKHPEKYSEPVIYRIHGQYIDFRHLSRDIQKDIIARLDPESNRI